MLEEDLQALDFLIWFGTGRQAAEQAGCNQSTISRRVNHVLATFRLTMKRSDRASPILGRHRDLLTLQRRVHQGRRLLGAGALRLAVTSEVLPLLRRLTLPDWVLGPADGVDTGMATLLEEHIVEAWIGCPADPPPDGAPTAAGPALVAHPLPATLQSRLLLPTFRTLPADGTLADPTGADPARIRLMVLEEHRDQPRILALLHQLERAW